MTALPVSSQPLRSDRDLPAVNRQSAEHTIWLSVDQVATLTASTKRAVREACKDRRLVSRTTTGNGGEQYQVRLDSLPETVRLRYWLERLGSTPAADDGTTNGIPESARQIALQRADLLRIYLRETEDRTGGSLTTRKQLFQSRFKTGEWPELLDALGTVSWKTLERWKKMYRDSQGDPMALAPKYKPVKGIAARKITSQQAEAILRYLLMANHLKVSEVIRQAREDWGAEGLTQAVDDTTIRRWIDDWKQENRDTFEYMVNGRKAWNDRVSPYIIRSKESVEVGDIVVADGHVLNFEILNPATGKPKRMTLLLAYDFRANFPLGWEIMPTENTQSIAAAYRRAILRLQFIPKVFYLDNGRAFRARFFKGTGDFEQAGIDGLFERLGSKVVHAWPYHGQSKTIERFFGTFSELERLQPSYTGTSIDTKPAHLHRGETLARSLRDNLQTSTTPTLLEAHELIANWFDDYVRRPQAQALRGLSPLQVAEMSLERVYRTDGFEDRKISEQQLRLLMMQDEVRTLYRNGIQWQGDYYWCDAFARMEKGKAQLRMLYDWQDREKIVVLDKAGCFIGIAERVSAIHPAARHLGTEEDVIELEAAINHRRAIEAGVKTTVKNFSQALYPKSESELPDLPAKKQENEPARQIEWTQITPPEPEESTNRIALFECDRSE